jgi:hypothetical protein
MASGVVKCSLCLVGILVELNVLRLPHLLVVVLLSCSYIHRNVLHALERLPILLSCLDGKGGVACCHPGEGVLWDLLTSVEDALELVPDEGVVRDVFVLQ